MRSLIPGPITAFCLIAVPAIALSQGEAAVPFLLISPSVESNGMAGTTVAVERADPLGAALAPAQVGLASLSTGIWGTTYPSKATWLPQFSLPDLYYKAWGVQGGVRLNDFVDLPFRLGFGVAYHRVDLNLGKFQVTDPNGPGVIATFNSYEYATGVTVGVGFEYLVKGGFGFTFRSISSHLSPIGTEAEQGNGATDARANDYGGYLMLPVVDLVQAAAGNALLPASGFQPFADISLGFAINNIGDSVIYVAAVQSDPLPRTARLGLGLAGGMRYRGWEAVGLTLSREAEDRLVNRQWGEKWQYQSGLGDISFFDNVVGGNSSASVAAHTGLQLRIGEMLTLRWGKVIGNYFDYRTEGFSVQLAGLLKGFALVLGEQAPSWFAYAANRLDVQYHQARYTATTSPLSGTRFEGLTMVVRVSPL